MDFYDQPACYLSISGAYSFASCADNRFSEQSILDGLRGTTKLPNPWRVAQKQNRELGKQIVRYILQTKYMDLLRLHRHRVGRANAGVRQSRPSVCLL